MPNLFDTRYIRAGVAVAVLIGCHVLKAQQLATIFSPVPSTQLPANVVKFSWNPGQGISQYWLDVGTTADHGDIFAGATTQTSQVVSNIPMSGIVYVRLWSYNGTWLGPIYYTYQPPAVQVAVMTSPAPTPAPGTQLATSTVTFTWTLAQGASQYWLDVGTIPTQGNISAGPRNTSTPALFQPP